MTLFSSSQVDTDVVNIADIDGSSPRKKSKVAKPEIIITDSDSDDGCGTDVANLEK